MGADDVDGQANGWSAIRAGFAVLDGQHWLLLVLLGSTLFFDGYDRGVMLVALKQIRATFGLSQAAASWYLSVLYLGALPAVFLALRADRVGRRKLLIVCVLGYSVATGVTALSPTAAVYTGCQFVARMFLNAEAAIVWTLAAESLPARARGIGFGWLQMCNALGVGFGAILFGGVIAPFGLSWRWLYVFGIPPLLLVAWFRRMLPESERFEEVRRAGKVHTDWKAVFRHPHRSWIVIVMVVGVLMNLSQQAGSFSLDFLQTQRHLHSSSASFMLVLAGLPGIPLMILAGAASDRYGRRLVGCLLAILGAIGLLAFFWLPGGIWVWGFAMVVMLLGTMGAGPVLGAYSAELFGTAVRGQAVAWSTVASVGGQALSFALGGFLLAGFNSLPLTVTLLGIGPVVALIIIWFRYPDTHNRELEEIHVASAS